MEAAVNTKHPDTPSGARAMLASDSNLDLMGAEFEPDPQVRGVWKFTLGSGAEGIVYLAGYPDPWGNVREHNDFEIEI